MKAYVKFQNSKKDKIVKCSLSYGQMHSISVKFRQIHKKQIATGPTWPLYVFCPDLHILNKLHVYKCSFYIFHSFKKNTIHLKIQETIRKYEIC